MWLRLRYCYVPIYGHGPDIVMFQYVAKAKDIVRCSNVAHILLKGRTVYGELASGDVGKLYSNLSITWQHVTGHTSSLAPLLARPACCPTRSASRLADQPPGLVGQSPGLVGQPPGRPAARPAGLPHGHVLIIVNNLIFAAAKCKSPKYSIISESVGMA